MKKMEISQMENVQGGYELLTKCQAGALAAGLATATLGPISFLIFGLTLYSCS
jgi:methylthioribose-1-phosphate isomerase